MVRILSNNTNNNHKLAHHNNNTSASSSLDALDIPDMARFVPLRLNTSERLLLQVLEQTLHVSEYTDHVDVTSARRGGVKTRRILDGILEVCHIATGLAVASGQERKLSEMCQQIEPTAFVASRKNHKKKKKNKSNLLLAQPSPGESWAGREPADNAVLFQTMFEIGRRNKVLNPSSMRTTYGKLMYLLQDAQNPTVAKSLGFSLHKELVLVGPYLEEHGCVDLLHDPRLECAIQFISVRDPDGERLDRAHVQALVDGKVAVTNQLVADYAKTSRLSEDNVRRAIESLADAVAYVESNVRPVQCMLQYLEDNFDPTQAEKPFSLTLNGRSNSGVSSPYSKYGFSAYSSGSVGPTLSHTHGTQYTFVWQSLRLWCKVQRNMHRLWVCADDDLLSTTSTYHLYNTGQGLNRVQNCPRVRKVMSALLQQTQQEAASPWVGLSVVHLGDRDVPNALIFIDKYTQIPRFLSPIVAFLQGLPDMCHDERLDAYVKKQFGSQHHLKMTVLADYFKHGFDGSGDDGGSCIDGRLTSSWNWTSRLAKKSYYHAFMLSGFQGFDGDFR